MKKIFRYSFSLSLLLLPLLLTAQEADTVQAPKSVSMGSFDSASRMLAGFTSRWMMPFLWV